MPLNYDPNFNNFNPQNYGNYNNSNRHYNSNNNKTPIKTNVMPTTSSNYGAYYANGNLNNLNRNIYY
jgi:hypothetical protein